MFTNPDYKTPILATDRLFVLDSSTSSNSPSHAHDSNGNDEQEPPVQLRSEASPLGLHNVRLRRTLTRDNDAA